jgi:hypothetical protein
VSSEAPISRAVRFVAVYRASWSEFFEDLALFALRGQDGLKKSELSLEDLRSLKSEGVGLISELFYIFRSAGLSSPTKLQGFLERHNSDMRALIASCQRGHTATGLSADRIKKSIFTERQIAYVIHESSHGELRLDQNSLQRILIQSMSFESCRSKLVLLAKFGLLRRHEYNQVLISSPGTLEDAYGRHLDRVLSVL